MTIIKSILKIILCFLQCAFVSAQDWEISISGQDQSEIGWSNTVNLGIFENASDGWNFTEDLHDLPNMSGEYTDLYFFHSDWQGSQDDAEPPNTCCGQFFNFIYKSPIIYSIFRIQKTLGFLHFVLVL